jgi:hypothetical protein
MLELKQAILELSIIAFEYFATFGSFNFTFTDGTSIISMSFVSTDLRKPSYK